DELRDSHARGMGELVELAGLRLRQNKGLVLSADDVVRRHHAALAVGSELFAIHVSKDLRTGAEVGDEADRLFSLLLDRASAGDERRVSRGWRRRAGELARGEDEGPALPQAALGKRHHLDHALIGFARRLAKGEDAMLVEDQALDVGLLLEDLGSFLGEP